MMQRLGGVLLAAVVVLGTMTGATSTGAADDDRPRRPGFDLQDLSQYRAATGTFQIVVDVEHDTPHVPSLIRGERTAFLGIGSVDATVDFTNVGTDRVTVSPDRRSVTIALPASRLAPAVVDEMPLDVALLRAGGPSPGSIGPQTHGGNDV